MNRILIDLPERIETPRLTLQMPHAGFGEKLHEAMLDGYEDGVRWLAWSPQTPSVGTIEEDCRKHHAEFVLREVIRYIILDKLTGEVIGGCSFPPSIARWLIPQFGILYWIRRQRRGEGYGAEAAHAMAFLAFKVLKAKKVEIYCDADNIASNKIPLKLNFDLEYTQRGGFPRPNGELAQLHTYAIFSPEGLPELEVKWRPLKP